MKAIIINTDSSFIRKVAYKNNNVAVVIGSTVYNYSGVSYREFWEFTNSFSIGKYYNRYIKGSYPCTRLA